MLGLGLFDFTRLEGAEEPAPALVRELAERRWAARQAKDFAESDRLRALIEQEGYTMRDRKEGYDLVRAGG